MEMTERKVVIGVNGKRYATAKDIQIDYQTSQRNAYRVMKRHFPEDMIHLNVKVKGQKAPIKRAIDWDEYQYILLGEQDRRDWYEQVGKYDEEEALRNTRNYLYDRNIRSKDAMIMEIARLYDELAAYDHDCQQSAIIKTLTIDGETFIPGPQFEEFKQWVEKNK